MSEVQNPDGRAVQLKRVRLSFTDTLFEKKAAAKDAEPKFGCNFIVESDQPEFEANKAKIIAAMKAAGLKTWQNEMAFQQISEDDPKRVCFRRGERFKNQETGQVYEGYAGNWAISASGPGGGKRRPKLLDRHKREVEEKDILTVCYSGSYADVILEFYGTNEGGRGIFCSIAGIRSHQEGTAMGGGGVAVTADMFDDLPDTDSFSGTGVGGSSGGSSGGGGDFIG